MKSLQAKIPSGNVEISGDLIMPKGAKAMVIFAHGSGSSRFSARNKLVAGVLNTGGIATLLIDLLTEEEEQADNLTAEFRFNIELLTERLISATEWIKKNHATEKSKIGYFGASTGAAAALIAGSRLLNDISAVVSRGGRPDLAGHWLEHVSAPTLLIVGGNDAAVIGMNETAFKKLHTEKKLVIIPKATHLFEEPGALEKVARVSCDWFRQYL